MRCACALSTALCSAFVYSHCRRHTNTWQGFGKRKNAVGMARPRKTKVEFVEEAREMAEEITNDSSSGGAGQCASSKATPAWYW